MRKHGLVGVCRYINVPPFPSKHPAYRYKTIFFLIFTFCENNYGKRSLR